jgi:hypothetical protein
MKYTKTVRASKKIRSARPVRASQSSLRRRAIKADVDFDDAPIDDIDAPVDDMPAPEDVEVAEVTVDDEATELLFEAEDVAELVSEVTGLPVDVTVDEDEVVFAVGDDEYTVTPEGDEEIVEQSTRMRKSARRVAASRKMPARRVAASRRVRK